MTGVVVQHDDGTETTLPAAVVVNCAGPWAGAVAAMHGMDLPVVPKVGFSLFFCDFQQENAEIAPFFVHFNKK
jgi:glycine/D-amino acid oxidase-like deaminating enzyme